MKTDYKKILKEVLLLILAIALFMPALIIYLSLAQSL